MLPLGLPFIGAGIGIGLGVGLGRELFGGMHRCCDGILGGPNRGAVLGGLTGGLLGGLGGGLGGALFGGVGGAILGRILDRHHGNHRRCQCHHSPFQGAGFPPPWGGGFGGPGQVGGWGPPPWGQQPGWGNPYQQGYNQGQYDRGYQDGYNAAQRQFGGYGQPPGHGYHGGMCPPDRCCPPWGPGSTGNPGGQLQQEGPGKPINYRTSGGWNVQVNNDKVIITDPTGQHKIEHSGDPHEYVNGKHVKDWEGKDRSILLPDGTKISMHADGPHGLIQNTSIYDGDQNVQINNNGNQVTHRSFNPYDTRAREFWQADGETSAVQRGFRGLRYDNLYTQDENLGVRPNYKQLAFSRNDTGFWGFPFFGPKTRDFYDDPRLAFT